MATREYALAEEGPTRLKLEWKGTLKDLAVVLDGTEIGRFRDIAHLRQGQEFVLPDGSHLKIVKPLKSSLLFLHVEIDGRLLLPKGVNPQKLFRQTCNSIYFIGGFHILIGLMSVLRNRDIAGVSIAPWLLMAMGGFFAVLGYLVGRKSTAALKTVMAFFILDAIYFFIHFRDHSIVYLIAGGLGSAFGLLCLDMGARAMRTLRLIEDNANRAKDGEPAPAE